MRFIRLSPMVVVLAVAACKSSPPLPKTEAAFCAAIDQAREAYDSPDEAGNDLAKEKAAAAARQARKQAVLAALGEGTLVGWIAQVENVSAEDSIDVRLPCKTKTLLKQRTKVTSQGVEPLSALKVGSWVLVTGTLTAGNPLDGFMEYSSTERGSMEEPEYEAAFVAIKPAAGADERLPVDMEPTLVAEIAAYRARISEEAKRRDEEQARQLVLLQVCKEAQRAVEAQFKTDVEFPSCAGNLGGKYKLEVLAEKRFVVQGPFTYVNAFGAKMKAYFHAEVEEGPEAANDPNPRARYKVVSTKLVE